MDKYVYVIPGAYSVDKNFRLATGRNWFRDEQLTLEEQVRLFEMIDYYYDSYYYDSAGSCLPIILSHTCPLAWEEHIDYLFMDGIDQENVNKDTEKFLDTILEICSYYDHWYFGHFHDDKDFRDIDATMLFKKIIPFGAYLEEKV